jgi:hypothetical protein
LLAGLFGSFFCVALGFGVGRILIAFVARLDASRILWIDRLAVFDGVRSTIERLVVTMLLDRKSAADNWRPNHAADYGGHFRIERHANGQGRSAAGDGGHAKS